MKKLLMFNMVSLDGFFEAPGHDISWHTVDSEFNDFAIEQLKSVDTLIFGKMTYELMASYWPTDGAINDDPAIAAMMNEKSKIVCSKTLRQADWNNTTLLGNNAESEIRKLKETRGKDLIIFGSAKLCSSFTHAGLIDEYRVLVSPQVLGAGTPLFRERMKLTLKSSRCFDNGNVLLTYMPASR